MAKIEMARPPEQLKHRLMCFCATKTCNDMFEVIESKPIGVSSKDSTKTSVWLN